MPRAQTSAAFQLSGHSDDIKWAALLGMVQASRCTAGVGHALTCQPLQTMLIPDVCYALVRGHVIKAIFEGALDICISRRVPCLSQTRPTALTPLPLLCGRQDSTFASSQLSTASGNESLGT